jgi:hypothetical protein
MARAERAERSHNVDSSIFDSNRNTSDFVTKHYTVTEIASLWNLSDDAVRKIFENEPGVLVIGERSSYSRKRRYRTLRIPELVVERVHRRLTRGVDSAPC